MYCPECGKWNDESARFCEDCGTELIDDQLGSFEQQSAVPLSTFSFKDFFNSFNQNISPFFTEKVKPFFSQKVKPFFTNHKLALSISAAVLVVICVGTGIVLSDNDPKKVVESYFSALERGDWAQAYSYLDLEDSQFVNKEMYAEYAKFHLDLSAVSDYSIEKFSGDENDNDSTLSYAMKYRFDQSPEYQYSLVTLNKQDYNSFLFFPCYKVAADDLLTSCTIAVLDSAKVTMDGIELTKSGETDEDGLALYYVNPVFRCNHTVVTSMDQCEDSVNALELSYEDYLDVSSMALSEEGIEKINGISQSYLKEMLIGAYKNTDYDELDIEFTSESKMRDSAKETYDGLINRFHGEEEIDDFEIKSISSTSDQDTIDSDLLFYSNMRYQIGYLLKDESFLSEEMETEYKNTIESATVVLKYENGEWVFWDARI